MESTRAHFARRTTENCPSRALRALGRARAPKLAPLETAKARRAATLLLHGHHCAPPVRTCPRDVFAPSDVECAVSARSQSGSARERAAGTYRLFSACRASVARQWSWDRRAATLLPRGHCCAQKRGLVLGTCSHPSTPNARCLLGVSRELRERAQRVRTVSGRSVALEASCAGAGKALIARPPAFSPCSSLRAIRSTPRDGNKVGARGFCARETSGALETAGAGVLQR